MNDEDYILMAKTVMGGVITKVDKLKAMMDLQFIDQALALQRMHSLTPMRTDKGRMRKNVALHHQIDAMLNHHIKERYEMGIMPRRFWLTEQWERPTYQQVPKR